MMRFLFALLLAGLAQIAPAAAEDYFVVCKREFDIFVLAHTWQYYGYEEFEEALGYYLEKKGRQGAHCESFFADLNSSDDAGPVLREYDVLLPDELPVYLHFYVWRNAVDEGFVTVLSTADPR